MTGWICFGSFLLLFGLWFFFRGGKYRQIFADEHFVEIAQGVAGMKRAALDDINDPTAADIPDPNDGRLLTSSAGLVIYYDITKDDDRFVHHYSISVGGGYTAHAVGRTFGIYVAQLLGVPLDTLTLVVTESSIHHIEFTLDPSSQELFAARAVPVVTLADVPEYRKRGMEANEKVTWQREKIGGREQG
jgi:hypothetical protein